MSSVQLFYDSRESSILNGGYHIIDPIENVLGIDEIDFNLFLFLLG